MPETPDEIRRQTDEAHNAALRAADVKNVPKLNTELVEDGLRLEPEQMRRELDAIRLLLSARGVTEPEYLGALRDAAVLNRNRLESRVQRAEDLRSILDAMQVGGVTPGQVRILLGGVQVRADRALALGEDAGLIETVNGRLHLTAAGRARTGR